METSSSIVDLRKLLASRFPQLRLTINPRPAVEIVPTGVPTLDPLLGGGLPCGDFTELIAAGKAFGSAEVIHELLFQLALSRQFLALVDGLDSFDPGAADPVVLSRLLWIRCNRVVEALKAVDLLLRDRNFPVVVLDFKLNEGRELRKIPASIWYRYGRLIEHHRTTLLVVTPRQLVSGAQFRVALDGSVEMEPIVQPRRELLACLRFKLMKSASGHAHQVLAQAS